MFQGLPRPCRLSLRDGPPLAALCNSKPFQAESEPFQTGTNCSARYCDVKGWQYKSCFLESAEFNLKRGELVILPGSAEFKRPEEGPGTPAVQVAFFLEMIM